VCRQIARFGPRAIVGFEISETALFHLERELRAGFPNVPFHAEIGSIQNPDRLAEVLERHAPNVLYHAAAYKHVPMMEAHIFEAVENNVFGTWNVAFAAATHGVADFVMISVRQGRSSDQRHGSDQARHRTADPVPAERRAEIRFRALRECTGQQW
jgi:FlaA1/EpsC-like NDP-sugar epimerase